MELRSDGSSSGVEAKRDRTSIRWSAAEVDTTMGAGFPFRYLVAVGFFLVQDIDQTSPNVKIMEL